ncbi:MAG: hypothetical protein ACREBQ_08025 [Nitrososphaerales archaeon]
MDQALRAGAGEKLQAVFVRDVGLGLALWRFHVLEVGGDGLNQCRASTAANLLNGFDSGTICFEFDGLATRAIDNFRAILDLLALSSVLPPLDVVVSLGMNLDLAMHADLIAEFTVKLDDSRIQVPVFADFYFLEDIDAIFASVALPRLDMSAALFLRREQARSSAKQTPC